MKRWYDEEYGMNFIEPDCVDEWLWHIDVIGNDYDGATTMDELKVLCNELTEMARNARECLWNGALFGALGSPDAR